MVDITSVKHLTLLRKDDVDSGPLSTGGDFKFGYETIKAFYVWINIAVMHEFSDCCWQN